MRLFDNGAGATVKKGKLRGKGADIPSETCVIVQQILTGIRQLLIQITAIIRLRS